MFSSLKVENYSHALKHDKTIDNRFRAQRMLPKQAIRGKHHLLEWNNFDKHLGISRFMHLHTSWKRLSMLVLDPDSNSYETQASDSHLNAAQMKRPEAHTRHCNGRRL